MDVPHAQPRFSLPFAGAYFFYYAGYCVFSSYAVMYLTQLGCSASLCGVLTSLTLCANLAMEPVGGYITDTFLPTKHYLMLCIGAIGALCLACTALAAYSGFTLAAVVLIAGLAYPFSQLMDAWVNCSRELDGSLVYSRVRSAGSVGFALTSAAAGLFFQRFGWGGYFVLQALLFGAMLPFLFRLPAIRLGNRMQTHRADHLSVTGAFATALKSPRFRFGLLLGTLFWCSHRPVGSYLSLIVTQRQGGSEVFGLVCAAGSAMESLALLALSLLTRKWSLHRRMGAALAANLLRPAILALLAPISGTDLPVCQLCHLLRRHRGLFHPGGGRTHPELLHLHGADRYQCGGHRAGQSGGRQPVRCARCRRDGPAEPVPQPAGVRAVCPARPALHRNRPLNPHKPHIYTPMTPSFFCASGSFFVYFSKKFCGFHTRFPNRMYILLKNCSEKRSEPLFSCNKKRFMVHYIS